MQTIREFFHGKVILIAGATGFLGQALVTKMLTALPDVKRIYLLIRSQTGANGEARTATDRLENDVFTSSAFAKLKQIHGERFDRWVREKVCAIEGDLAYERLGLSDADYETLQREVQVFINSGGLVKFDPPIDASLQSNVLGAKYAVELAKSCNDAILLHVSTAYVRGVRPGKVPEELHPPYETYAQQYQAEKGEVIPGTLDAEIEDIQRLSEQVRNEANQPERLDQFRREALRNLGAVTGDKLNRQIDIAREKWVEQRLIDEGLKRAHARGWNDTYTYMKALGEQMIAKMRGDLPTAIIRQSIMESSLEDPEPGWLGGTLRMADPLIVGFGKGRLPDFPGDPNSILDIIPVDFVINAMLAATVQTYHQRGIEVYHVASGARNPLTFGDIVNITHDYFVRQPMLDNGQPIPVPVWKFPDKEKFQKDLHHKLRLLDTVSRWLSRVPLRWAKRKDRRIAVKRNAIETLLHYVQIYSPYVRLSFQFEIGKTEELYRSLSPSDQQLFNFDISRIDWRDYLQEIHIPGIKRHFLKLGDESGRQRISEPTPEQIDELPADSSSTEGEFGNEQPIDEPSKPLKDQTMIDLVAQQAESIPDKIALQMKRNGEWVRYSYRQLYEVSRQVAFVLWERGYRKGDRVILFAENQPEWGIAYLAAVQIGVVVVPIDPQTAEGEIFALTEYTEAKGILTSEAGVARLHNAHTKPGAEAESLEFLDINRFCQPFGSEQAENSVPTKSELPAVPDQFPNVDIDPDTVASIIFTMGTTVDPRGAMLSHRGFIANVMAVSQALPPEDTDRFLSVLPLYHALGFSCNFLMSIYAGTTVTYTNSLRPTTILAIMRETKITVLIGVPRLFQLLYDAIKRYVVQSPEAMEAPLAPEVVEEIQAALGGHIRVLVSGGAALPDEIYDLFMELGLTIYQGYGMTEASPVLSVNPHHKSKRSSVGPAVQGVQLQIINPDEAGVGEIVAHSPSLMQGYYRNQAVTGQVIRDGLLHTGDLGYFDEEGYLYLTGRSKDVIVSGAGKNIYPVELEALYRHSSLISEICVVGMSTDNMFEAAHAVIVPVCDDNRDRAEVEKAIHQHIQECAQDLPTYQHIQTVHFWDTELPQTSDAVINRQRVKEILQEQLSQQTQVAPQPDPVKGSLDADGNEGALKLTMATDTASGVEEVIISELSRLARLPADQIRLNSNLGTELGLDSMARVELLLLLESRLQRSIPDELIAKIQTVGDVTETVKALQSEATPPPIDEEISAHIEQSESSHLSTTLAGLFRFSVWAIYRYYFSIKCSGLENLPREQPYIIAANHSSHLDTLAVMTVLGDEFKRLRVLAAKDYWFSTRFKSWFSGELLKFVPFDRHANFLQGLRISQEVLKQDECLLIYPEGTRSVTGELQPFKPGLGLLAYESGSPIIPAYIDGTYHALPKGKNLPRKSRIQVIFGKPIVPSSGHEVGEMDAASGLEHETYRKLADAVRSEIEALRADYLNREA
jgi:long-chain acyl-CoA synthetase